MKHAMIKKIVTLAITCFSITQCAYAQVRLSDSKAMNDVPENSKLYRSFFRQHTAPIDMIMSGYVKNDVFWQTRQIVSLQEGNILLLPAEPAYDVFGQDTEAHGAYNIMPIETMIRFDFMGPELNCMKTSGAIEASFWGQTVLSFGNETPNLSINMLTMDHAYLQLEWPDFALLAGQTTHPIAHDVPDTVCYNVGMPIVPFAFSPQVRFTYHASKADLIFAATSELNWQSNGPYNFITQYIRNGILPNLHAQARIQANELVSLGLGLDVKRIVPRLMTDNNVKANEHLYSGAAFAHLKFEWERYYLLLKGVWAQNGVDYDLTGGYAVSSINPVTDHRTYTNFNTISFYIDTKRDGILEPGLFCGVLKNLGTTKNIIPSITVDGVTTSLVYDFAANVDTVLRVSPRLRYNIDPVVIGTEIEYTRAAWGTLTNQGTVVNTSPKNVVRFELGIYFYF